MRLFYTILSYALAALGVLHMGATFRFFSAFTSQSLWFFTGGMLMVLVAALNLLNRTYGQNARGLRVVCMAANVVVTALAIAAGTVGKASALEWVVVMGIVVPLTALSFSTVVVQRNAA